MPSGRKSVVANICVPDSPDGEGAAGGMSSPLPQTASRMRGRVTTDICTSGFAVDLEGR